MSRSVLARCSLLLLSPALFVGACTTQDMANIVGGDLGSTSQAVTYYRDVLPLAQKHCTSCHYPGGIGPFSMMTYEDAAPHAQVISEYVKTGQMPPWKPADGCRSLKDVRKLSSDEIATFTNWYAASAPAGDPADAPPTPPDTSGLTTVSTTMKMAAPYTPPAAETDHYQCFILDPKLAANADLIGYNVHPGTSAEVHHVLLFPAAAADAKALDDASPDELGWTCFGGPGTPSPRTIGGWVPGSGAVRFPQDTGIELIAGEVLVMQIHYNLSYTKAAPDQTSLDFEFAPSPVKTHAQVLPVLNATFSVPPGAMNQDVKAQLRTPVAGKVWGTLPHAHTNAQRMYVDSDAGCMVDIPQWDFHWQQMYFFEEPLAVKAGQQLRLTCTYDNPGSTPLRWGEKTSDEMCINYFYVTQ